MVHHFWAPNQAFASKHFFGKTINNILKFAVQNFKKILTTDQSYFWAKNGAFASEKNFLLKND